jgi:hypothetical protein
VSSSVLGSKGARVDESERDYWFRGTVSHELRRRSDGAELEAFKAARRQRPTWVDGFDDTRCRRCGETAARPPLCDMCRDGLAEPTPIQRPPVQFKVVELGSVSRTRAVAAWCSARPDGEELLAKWLAKHEAGQWTGVRRDRVKANDRALRSGGWVVTYHGGESVGCRVWIVTSVARCETTVGKSQVDQLPKGRSTWADDTEGRRRSGSNTANDGSS